MHQAFTANYYEASCHFPYRLHYSVIMAQREWNNTNTFCNLWGGNIVFLASSKLVTSQQNFDRQHWAVIPMVYIINHLWISETNTDNKNMSSNNIYANTWKLKSELHCLKRKYDTVLEVVQTNESCGIFKTRNCATSWNFQYFLSKTLSFLNSLSGKLHVQFKY